jgi:hypothetical protein
MANRVELTVSRIVIESVCGERGGILPCLHGVHVRAEKETIFYSKRPGDTNGLLTLFLEGGSGCYTRIIRHLSIGITTVTVIN